MVTPVLPDDLWNARPELDHIRRLARHRIVSPDMLLLACLARVATASDWRLCLPPLVGAASPIGLYACGWGPSSGGKTASMLLAREAIPVDDPTILPSLKLGSGEGLIERFWGTQEVETARGKPTTEAVRTAFSALLSADEGTMMSNLTARTGSTLGPLLLSAWAGADVGTTVARSNGSATKRELAAGTYRFSLVLGLQPANAATLLDPKVQGDGLPQRFVNVLLGDRGADEDQPDPGPLQFKPPTVSLADGLRRRYLRNGPDERLLMGVPSTVERQVRSEQAAIQRYNGGLIPDEEGWTPPDPLAGHDRLNRLRVAANLALLDSRLDLDVEDWELAGAIMANSAEVRTSLLETMAAARRAERESQVHIRAAGQMLAEQQRIETLIERAIEGILRILANGPATKRELAAGLSRYQREVLEDAIDRAVTQGLIAIEGDGRYRKC